MRKLFHYLKPYWIYATLAPLLMLLEVFMNLLQPMYMKRIVDVGIAQMDMTYVFKTGLMMIFISFISLLGGLGCVVFSELASQHFGADLRKDAYKKVQSLSFGNIDRIETGHLITRLTNDITLVQDVISMMLRILARAPFQIIGSIIMAALLSPKLTILLVLMIFVLLGALALVMRKGGPLFKKVQSMLDKVNAVMQENLAGIRVVKAFVREKHEIQRFEEANENLKDMTMKASRYIALIFPIMMLVINATLIAVIWFGGIEITVGNMQVGGLMAFTNYLMQLLMSLIMMAGLMMMVSRASASSERIQEVLDNEADIKDKDDAVSISRLTGKIKFEKVTFNYDQEKHDPVLKNISFNAEPGETVAILGATGSGKTSLVNLIPRLYDVTEGSVQIDGKDIRDYEKKSLRKNIGMALQQSILFSGTIRENIKYGCPDVSDEVVIKAAKAAQAHEFISSLPEGYDTELGQRGVNLSGGQKQRIAIARALITKPAILILDDSTSAVDVKTESFIQDELKKMMKQCTSIIVAQRISTVLEADKILVLEDGEIVAEGNHNELMLSSQIYQDIYQSQLGEKEVFANG